MIKLILIIFAVVFFSYFLKEIKFFPKVKKFFSKIEEKNWEKRYFASLKKKNVDSTQIVNRLGEFYISQGRYGEARMIYEKVYAMLGKGKTKDNITWNIFSGLALMCEKQGDFDLAIEYIKRGETTRMYFSIGASNFYLEKICLILSRCYVKKGDEEKAIDCIDKYCLENVKKDARAKVIKQAGEIFLELSNYEKSEKYFRKEEISLLNKTTKSEANYFLCMALLGKKDYVSILKMSKSEDFFQSNSDALVLGLYSCGMANIKQKRYKEAKEKLDRISNLIISRLDSKEFYKFYYYNFLLYYGLGSLSSAQKNQDDARMNFQKILDIMETVSDSRYKYSAERNNIYFFKLLANFELIKIEKNAKKKKETIKMIKVFLNQLTQVEKKSIGLKEVGNDGSIIIKINNLK
ncbi:MAG: tetratricopeptide repeat protein [Candidatus ainarchaeum sp.]|nr:tetratricopeptide repeat protein [Candidatus ainarchaeum sp.]MDD3940519.1 tetratricopeptide repeat protein [Candidatus Paceibacterota bacterium]MDD4468099.1 tetratricopeptide repeat protein [Candidatus ainarchaeum sp.]